jgi:hypothetical protein
MHIVVSLCLSFYNRCNLGGYTMGTTTGFPVEIVDALTQDLTAEFYESACSNI